MYHITNNNYDGDNYYDCLHLEIESLHNRVYDKIILYTIRTKSRLSLSDNPVTNESCHYSIHVDNNYPVLDIDNIYLVPNELKSYVLNYLFTNIRDDYLKVFFESLFHDFDICIGELNLNSQELIITSNYESVSYVHRTLEAIKTLYKKIFTHIYSQHESLGYPLLSYNRNFDSLFEDYYIYHLNKKKFIGNTVKNRID